MRIVMRGVLAVCAVVGFALSASGQVTSGVGTGTHHASQPYTAQFKITSVQTLANGTTITRESTELQAEDSQGRHVTVATQPAIGQMPERSIYRVNDPVNRVNISWISPGKVATIRNMLPPRQAGQARICWAEGPATSADAANTTDHSDSAGELITKALVGLASQSPTVQMVHPKPAAADVKSEQLGKQTIQGVEAFGRRTTTTIPAGTEGNDAPLVTTFESWRAYSLLLNVREVRDDPRSGKWTKELTELNQSEPDEAMFQPPEGYEVKTIAYHEVPCTQ